MANKPTIPNFPTLPDFGQMITQACEVVTSVRGIPYDFNGTLSLENKFVVLFKTVKEMFDAQDELVKSYKALHDFINQYFSNLDLQNEVNKKIKEMKENGELLNLLKPTVSNEVAAWLKTNITNPSNPPIDKSLTVENAAADAKTTGDNINNLTSNVRELVKNQENIKVQVIMFDIKKNSFNLYMPVLKPNHKYALKIAFKSGLVLPFSTYDITFGSWNSFEDRIDLYPKIKTNEVVMINTNEKEYSNSFIWVADSFPLNETLILQVWDITNMDYTENMFDKLPEQYVTKYIIIPSHVTEKRNIKMKAGYYRLSLYSLQTSEKTFGISTSDDTSIKARRIINQIGEHYINFTIDKDGEYTLWCYTESKVEYSLSLYELQDPMSKNIIYIAANNSTNNDKKIATYVCDGVNDEYEINFALSDIGECGTVYLLGGDYYIDEFQSYSGYAKSAIAVLPVTGKRMRGVTIKGISHYFNGTNIHVTQNAFNSVKEEEQPCVINVLAPNNTYWRVDIQNLAIILPDWKRKAIMINLDHCGCGEEKNLKLTAFGDASLNNAEYKPNDFSNTSPIDGLVGIRSFAGWTYGDTTRFDNISVWGCHVAFQLGAEHLICNSLRARHNYCGYTFGEYYNKVNYGAFDHPTTLINCCDEQSYQGPIFSYCGVLDPKFDTKKDRKLQGVTFIDFNTEQFAKLAKETNPGTFCGVIMFHPSDGTYGAYVNAKFWEDGSGHNFKTVNLTHAQGGTSSLRKTYAPNYMQQYYDTDLNKLLIYDGISWKDLLGNDVD